VGDHVARRRELLRVAGALVAVKGCSGLSIRALATAAGCSTGTVTYYFANKDDITAALADRIFDAVAVWPERAKASTEVEKVIAQMLRSVMTLETQAWSIWFRLLEDAGHSAQLTNVIRARYLQFRSEFADAIRLGQNQGGIRNDIAAEFLADQICAMADGWLMSAPIEKERFTSARREALVDAALKLIDQRLKLGVDGAKTAAQLHDAHHGSACRCVSARFQLHNLQVHSDPPSTE